MSINEIESKARELRQLQALIDEATAEAEALKDAIKAAMGDAEEVHAGEYKITWKPVTAYRLDTAALKKALPGCGRTLHQAEHNAPFLCGVTEKALAASPRCKGSHWELCFL